GGQGRTVPYEGIGTVDAKVVDAAMARQMSFAARWGSACGTPFLAAKFLAAHPQFEWMTGLLQDRPAQPWTIFEAGEVKLGAEKDRISASQRSPFNFRQRRMRLFVELSCLSLGAVLLSSS